MSQRIVVETILLALASWASLVHQLPAQVTAVFGDPRELAIEMRIRQSLQKRAEWSFSETPLKDAIEFIESEIGCPIIIDYRALEDAGVGTDTEITFRCSGISSFQALAMMLKRFDLTWTNGEAIIITTPEVAEAELVTRVYPVVDLVAFPDAADGEIKVDFDSLIGEIMNTVSPTNWDQVGGPGTISASYTTGSLVISQTYRVHREVESLLAGLREARAYQQMPDFTKEFWQDYVQGVTTARQEWTTAEAQPEIAYSSDPATVPSWQRPRRHD